MVKHSDETRALRPKSRSVEKESASRGRTGQDRPTQPPLVVGIGASAGGLEAFKSFFAKMPADSGLAFVLVQHLNPDHSSILTELIGRQTVMAVCEAADGMPVQPDTVFVIPPNATLTISDGRLRLERPAPPRQNRHPINSFFTSLAESQGENAVGIILAGTGSDGSIGIRAIKAHGGLTLAQAGFDHSALSGMPQSAAATGLVDHVMQVGDMPAQLIEYALHLRGVALFKDGDGARRDMEDHLTTISNLLRAAVGHDFGQYKQTTLARRVQRRMQVLRIESVPDFIERLRTDPPQLDLLFREFLIGVTQFFRDPDAFEALRTKGFAALLDANQSDDPLRIWVPACATGEEVYSIAILLKEEMERRGISRPIQIFGTDIDDSAVAVARCAFYPKAMPGMSAERIERWFVPHGDGYCPIKQIREICIFSVHSIIRDPPFSKLDMISCRNLMIYLDGDLQERVVRSFHYALKPGGILFLGPSEGITRGTKFFSLLDKRSRVFERRHTDAPTRLPEFSSVEIGVAQPRVAVAPGVNVKEDRLERNARNALEKYSLAYVVIDEHFEVVRFSGGAVGLYLEPTGGAPSLNLFSLLRRTLRPVVRAAVQMVFANGQSVLEEQISIRIDGVSHTIKVIAEPLGGGRGNTELCLVAFQDLGVLKSSVGKRSARSSGSADVGADGELRTTNARLLAAAADLETANEDAASAAEEYQSVNEELQSSNEELETAKEEMQSINEELQTVNAELSSKNDQLARTNSDLQNLFDSTDIATVFLDTKLRVKGYTPAITELFHLRDTDRGRPLDEIVSRITYGDLRDDVTSVLRDTKSIEREVEIASGGATFIMRIRPYRTLDRVVDGIVITFVDISGRKKMEEALREHAAIVEFSPDALISMTLDGTIRSWNPGAEHLFGYSASEAIGKPISLLGGIDGEIGLMDRAKAGAIAGPLGVVRVRRNGADVDIELAVMPIRNPDGTVTALALSARDIADRKEADTHRTFLLRELSHRVKNTLATVQAIATQTLRTTTSRDAFVESFSPRLLALAKTYDLLTRGEWQGAALADIVEAELAPYQSESRSRGKIDGPTVLLNPKAALALGMAFHELATNAAKHGALSAPNGHVEVTWQLSSAEPNSRLHLLWVETGGPTVVTPAREGFGKRLISTGLAHELDGEATLEFDPIGVRCVIDIPLVGTEAVK